VDTAESLCKAAKLIGWTAIVGDARAMFLTRERMPSADLLIQKWPEEALAEIVPDHQTAVVVLTHDDKFDEPALKAALESEAFYVGALGSRRTTASPRPSARDRRAGGSSRGSWARAASTSAPTRRRRPRSPILAEILAVRAGRSGGIARLEAADPRRGWPAESDAMC
jgi:xanthine dehydrogenase accessory factor